MRRTARALVTAISIWGEISRAACFFLPAALPTEAALPSLEAILCIKQLRCVSCGQHFLMLFGVDKSFNLKIFGRFYFELIQRAPFNLSINK